jgi:hypothetical protein
VVPFPIALLCCELLFGQPVVANSSSAIVDAVCLPLMRTLGYGVQRNRDRV